MTKHLIIIPVYNKLQIVKRTLTAYIKNTNLKGCITYVIDDGSDKQTSEYLKKFLEINSGINLLRNNKNIGKPKSINKIINLNQDADFITIIDRDVKVLTKNWNDVLLKAHKIWDNKAILGGKINQKGFEFKKGRMIFGDVFPFWTLAGGFFSIPKFVFKKLGYFYDRIRRHEDADYCRRAATQNIRWYYTPNIKTRMLKNKSVSNSQKYSKIKKQEKNIYKKRATYIMTTHDVYYNPFKKGLK
ncbi:MAG: glycosyltransferase [Patescibacteria group bacterium]|nr:glycosyltransferase [Patescibacteria group bacterium]